MKTGSTKKQKKVSTPAESRVWNSLIMCAAVVLSCFVLWGPEVRDCLPAGDSGELIVSAVRGGSPHPPGYPLFTVAYGAAARFSRWMQWSPTLTLNEFTAVLSMTTALLLSSLFTTDKFVGLGVALAWVSMPTVRMLSTQTEVFALHHFSLVIAFVVFERWWVRRLRRDVLLLAASCAVVVVNQHAGLLAVAPLIAVVAFASAKSAASPRAFLRLVAECVAVAVLVMLCAVLVIYWNQSYLDAFRSRYGWGDGNDGIVGAMRHFFRADYGTFQLHRGGLSDGTLTREILVEAMRWMQREGCAAALGAALLIVSVNKQNWGQQGALVWIYAASAASGVLGLALIGNVPLTHGVYSHVYHRLWAQTSLPICTALGHALIGSRWKRHFVALLFAVVAFEACCGPSQPLFRPSGDLAIEEGRLPSQKEMRELRHEAACVLEAFAMSATAYLPHGAVIYTLGDVYLTSLRYGLAVRRRDGGQSILHVDRELLSYKWAKRWLVKTLRIEQAPDEIIADGYWTVQHLAMAVNAGPGRQANPAPLFLLESPEFVVETPSWKETHAYYAEGWFYRLTPKAKHQMNCSLFDADLDAAVKSFAEDPALSLFSQLVSPKVFSVDVSTLAVFFPWESLVLQQYFVARKNLLLRAATEAQICLGRRPQALLQVLRRVDQILKADVALPHHYAPAVFSSSVEPFVRLLETTIESLSKVPSQGNKQ